MAYLLSACCITWGWTPSQTRARMPNCRDCGTAAVNGNDNPGNPGKGRRAERTITRALVKSRRLRRLVAWMEAAIWDLSAAQMPLACSRNRSGRALPTLQAEADVDGVVETGRANMARTRQHAVVHL